MSAAAGGAGAGAGGGAGAGAGAAASWEHARWMSVEWRAVAGANAGANTSANTSESANKGKASGSSGNAKTILWVTMHSEPVNSMTLEFWQGLLAALQLAESNPQARAIVFSSGLKRDIFTAGNDIKELYSKSTTHDRFMQFWRAQTHFLSRLYRSRLITAACIRGVCPAGGCILALCCDYRVQSAEGDPTIGLNEVALGMSVPKRWAELFVRTVGTSLGERLLLTGRQLTCTQAKQCGVLDDVVPVAQLREHVERELHARLRLPDTGRVLTKRSLREAFGKVWESEADEEARQIWAAISSSALTAQIGAVLKRLSGGASAKL